jgi:GTP-binding protein HflX
VQRVLAEIGAGEVPQLLVFNKLDALETAQQPLHLQDEIEVDGVQVPRIFLSAHSGRGVPELRAELALRSGAVSPPMTLAVDAELHDAAP